MMKIGIVIDLLNELIVSHIHTLLDDQGTTRAMRNGLVGTSFQFNHYEA
jgi:hypothetical protein